MRPNLTARSHLEGLELQEYIGAFKASSDRTRYVIYINTIFTLLIVIASWNIWPASWSRRRIDYVERPVVAKYREEFEKKFPRSSQVKPNASPPKAPLPHEWEKARAKYVADKMRLERWTEYRSHALDRILFVPVPGLGMHVDVNDLGLIGGTTLFVLTLLLCLAMVRQHENLYLAFFKIKRICERERLEHHDGESMANFLYHALAMGQVLSYPPTLARWGYGRRNQYLGFARASVFVLPTLVHGAVFVSNCMTFSEATNAWGWGTAIGRMGLQLLLLLGIATFCILSVIYSRSCSKRWRTMFDLINPGLKLMEQRPWKDWVQFGAKKPTPPLTHRPILTEITYSLRPDGPAETLGICSAVGSLQLNNSASISQVELLKMATLLHDNAVASAKKVCTDDGKQLDEIVGYETEKSSLEENTLKEKTWKVKLSCTFTSSPSPP